MQGYSVFLASRTEEENQILRRKLEPLQNEFRDIRFVGLHPQGLAFSAQEKMAVAIINVTEWNMVEASNLKGLRSQGYSGPVLVTAKPSTSLALKTLRAMDNVVFLEKPFEPKDLVGIVSKMLHARRVSQRIHRRFNTDELAEVQVQGQRDRHRTRLTNLSKGGAFLELVSPAQIHKGDMVSMKVELRDVNRAYTLPARVVWSGRPKNGGNLAVGVEFVGQPEVKRLILGNF